MKKAFLLFLGLGLTGCAVAPQTANVNSNANTKTAVNPSNSTVTSTHSSQANAPTVPQSSGDKSPTMTGNARAIDTSEFDAAIAKADKEFKQKPKDEAAKKALVEAYLTRADALTEAAQYRAALGDYRRALKLDPNNQDAKQWIDQIVGIFKSLNREAPKEGEEPPPMPYKKEA